jgi:hypothetical protein
LPQRKKRLQRPTRRWHGARSSTAAKELPENQCTAAPKGNEAGLIESQHRIPIDAHRMVTKKANKATASFATQMK